MNCDDYFNQIAKPGKCEVCGAEELVVVLASSFGPCSCAYCKECYDFNLEPYYLCGRPSDIPNHHWRSRKHD